MNESQIFANALKLATPSERAAYLDKECAGNSKLRADVEALLQAHATDPGFLESPAATAGSPDPATTEAASTEQPGIVLAGRYKLLDRIGEGGMGTVWLAEQTAPVKRQVALKLIKAGMSSKAVLARFETERQALALMDHPNIAKVLDAGAAADGRPFFVMELVKGIAITKYCDDHRLTPRERLELFAPVCHAIQHAHQKGIIHRDIKPSNVLVALYDDRPVPKVIDFGVAKATGQQLTEETLHTGFGAVVGTLEYMSPEQAGFNQLDIDTRSDIYSMGVLLYELLAGSPPFGRKELERIGLMEMLRVIREQEPSKPSTKLSSSDALPTLSANRATEPARLTKLVRGELDWIVMKALEKDRSRRYETASALVMDVQRYLADEPVLAGPPSATYRLRKFVQRHKGAVLAASIIALLLVAGITGTTAGLVSTLAAERRAIKERDDKEEARRQTRQALNTMTDEVVEDLIGRQVELTDEHRQFLKKVLAYHEAFANAKADDPEGRQSRAEGYYRVGRIRQSLGEIREAETALRAARAILQQLDRDFAGRRDSRRSLVRCDLEIGRVLGEYSEIVEGSQRQDQEGILREAMTIGKQLLANAPETSLIEDLSKCESNLAMSLLARRQASEAETLFRDSLAHSKQLAAQFPNVPKYSLSVAQAWHNLALLYLNTNQAKEMEEALQESIALRREFARRFADRPEVRRDLASNYMSLGVLLDEREPQEAEEAWNKALSLQKQLVLEFPSRTDMRIELALIQNNLGTIQMNGGQLPAAEATFRDALLNFKVLAAKIRNRPDLRFQVAVGHQNLGVVLDSAHRPKEAEAAWRDSAAVFKQLVDDFPDKQDYRAYQAMLYEHLAHLFRDNDHPVDAEKWWRDALAEYVWLGAKGYQVQVHVKLGLMFQNQRGRLDDAIAEYDQAIRIDPKFAGAHTNRGNALALKGELDQAIVEYRTALGLDQDQFEAHLNLGVALWHKGENEESIKECREAIRLNKESARAHDQLGRSLQATGDLKNAIAAHREAVRLEKEDAQAQEHLRVAERLGQLEERLPAILEGKDMAKDAGESLGLAQLCQPPYREHYAAATRFLVEAFAADPKLTDVAEAPHRYNAACTAALAGTGKGQDADGLAETERARLRHQALDWLRADLAEWNRRFENGQRDAPLTVDVLMQHWLDDLDLATLRGPEALAKLPEAERQPWLKLWEDVAELLKRARPKPAPQQQ